MAQLQPGQPVGGYVVERWLGGGGMAEVYLVRHAILGSPHALKVLNPELLVHEDVRQRFLAEGRIQSGLRHANVVAVTDLVSEPGVAGLVMEFVPGPTLEAWRESGPPPLDAVKAIVKGILAGAGAAHAAGVVHRDLKPANVILSTGHDGALVPKLLDFGIAKVDDGDGKRKTRAGARMGTVQFMSPEQIRGASAVDARSDLWSIGVILYELLAGRVPFEGADDFETMQRIDRVEYVPIEQARPDVPPSIAWALRRVLQRDPSARFPDARSFREALEGGGGSWSEVPPPRALPPMARSVSAPVLPPVPEPAPVPATPPVSFPPAPVVAPRPLSPADRARRFGAASWGVVFGAMLVALAALAGAPLGLGALLGIAVVGVAAWAGAEHAALRKLVAAAPPNEASAAWVGTGWERLTLAAGGAAAVLLARLESFPAGEPRPGFVGWAFPAFLVMMLVALIGLRRGHEEATSQGRTSPIRVQVAALPLALAAFLLTPERVPLARETALAAWAWAGVALGGRAAAGLSSRPIVVLPLALAAGLVAALFAASVVLPGDVAVRLQVSSPEVSVSVDRGCLGSMAPSPPCGPLGSTLQEATVASGAHEFEFSRVRYTPVTVAAVTRGPEGWGAAADSVEPVSGAPKADFSTVQLRALAEGEELSGLTVRLDGAEAGRTPLTGLLVTSGRHEFKVSGPCWKEAVQAYDSAPGNTGTLLVVVRTTLEELAPASPAEVEAAVACLVPGRLRRQPFAGAGSGPSAVEARRAKLAREALKVGCLGADRKPDAADKKPGQAPLSRQWLCDAYAGLLLAGLGGPADAAEASRLRGAACARGVSTACLGQGLQLWLGLGVPRNVEKGARLIEAACAKGAVEACAVAGAAMVDELEGFPSNPEKGLERLARACGEGVGSACVQRALRLASGLGVLADPTGALASSDRSCDLGVAEACAWSGLVRGLGLYGFAADGALAVEFQRRACAAGHVASCTATEELDRGSLGSRYEALRREVRPLPPGCPRGMVFVPPGELDLGNPPRHVSVPGFCLDRTEFPWSRSVRVVAHGDEGSELPLTEVTLTDAREECRSRGLRLPAEYEWELAAQGATGRRWPWGAAPPDCSRAASARCGNDPLPVGQRPMGRTPEGVEDLAGNVAEWVEGCAGESGSMPAWSLEPEPEACAGGIARGGSYADGMDATGRSSRERFDAGEANRFVGFRCARSAP